MRKRLCKAAKRSKGLAVIRRHTKKPSSRHSTNIWPCASFGATRMGTAPSTLRGRVSQVWLICHVQHCQRYAPQCWPRRASGDRVCQAMVGFLAKLSRFRPHALTQSLEVEPGAAPRRELPLDEGSRPHEGGHVCPLWTWAGSRSIPRIGSMLAVRVCTGLSRVWVTPLS